MTVTDTEIIKAMKEIGKNEGIFAEPAAATSYAGLVKAINNNLINKDDKTVVIITGNGLKDQQSVLNNTNPIIEVTKEEIIDTVNNTKGNQIKDFLLSVNYMTE